MQQPGGANNQSILNNFDYTAIDELDPSLSKFMLLNSFVKH